MKRSETRFDAQTWLLLVVNGLFAAASALSGMFVYIYLWKVNNNYAWIGWYVLLQQVVMALTFWIAGRWVKQANKMHVLRFGVTLSALFYVLVLILEQRAAAYVLLLGFVYGLSAGLFWLSFNVIYFEVTSPETRDRFNGWVGITGSALTMVAPWLSGLLISRLANGYRFIFGISLALFVVGVIVSLFLRNRHTKGLYEWSYGWRMFCRKGSEWRYVCPALLAQGVREGVFVFLISLLVYVATSSEFDIGQYYLYTSAVGLVSFLIVGKWLPPASRNKGMLIGSIAMVLCMIPLFVTVNYTTLLLFGLGTALCFPLYTIPMTSSVFDLIGKDKESANHRVEYIVLREVSLNVGRIAGLALFIAGVSLDSGPVMIRWLMFGLGCFPFLAWVYMRPRLQLYQKS